VLKRYVDIGDHVKAGQLLAEISAPEIDDQIAQNAPRRR
jgi:multidrug efflux pump subunit AcrA (membrane-fusion protein)